ncbi:hypothetical protein HU200_050747 [Digitaria exilis]|uniref:Uncharacterized protein n=1 Tax=Digitaria exilis TaxID=1010633 RepID=A0A835B1X1_9POAL|nr:hypothetical protein HU200_050747 [Digitaria exilis]
MAVVTTWSLLPTDSTAPRRLGLNGWCSLRGAHLCAIRWQERGVCPSFVAAAVAVLAATAPVYRIVRVPDDAAELYEEASVIVIKTRLLEPARERQIPIWLTSRDAVCFAASSQAITTVRAVVQVGTTTDSMVAGGAFSVPAASLTSIQMVFSVTSLRRALQRFLGRARRAGRCTQLMVLGHGASAGAAHMGIAWLLPQYVAMAISADIERRVDGFLYFVSWSVGNLPIRLHATYSRRREPEVRGRLVPSDGDTNPRPPEHGDADLAGQVAQRHGTDGLDLADRGGRRRVGEEGYFAVYFAANSQANTTLVQVGTTMHSMASARLVVYLETVLAARQQSCQRASNVTSWFRTSYLTPVFGAIVADTFRGNYSTILVSLVVYLLGIMLSTFSAFLLTTEPCVVGSIVNNVAFLGLYLVAFGITSAAALLPFGAEQYHDDSALDRAGSARCPSSAADHHPRGLGFGVATACVALAFAGSVLATPMYFETTMIIAWQMPQLVLRAGRLGRVLEFFDDGAPEAMRSICMSLALAHLRRRERKLVIRGCRRRGSVPPVMSRHCSGLQPCAVPGDRILLKGHFGRPNPRGVPGLFPGPQPRAEFGPGLNFPCIWKPTAQGSSARSLYFPRGVSFRPLESGPLFPERHARRNIVVVAALPLLVGAPLPPPTSAPPRWHAAPTSDLRVPQRSTHLVVHVRPVTPPHTTGDSSLQVRLASPFRSSPLAPNPHPLRPIRLLNR